MALIKCPDCRAEMSDVADSCARCGRVRERSSLGVASTVLFLVFNGVMAVWFIAEVLSWLEVPSGLMGSWATGSVILGMFALVTGRLRRRARPYL